MKGLRGAGEAAFRVSCLLGRGGPFRVSRGTWNVGKHIQHSADAHENQRPGACLDPFASQFTCHGRGSTRWPLPGPANLSPVLPALPPAPQPTALAPIGMHYAFLQTSGHVFFSLFRHQHGIFILTRR